MVGRQSPFRNRALVDRIVKPDLAIPLNRDFRAYWNCQEANGNRVDATGNGNDLIQVSGVVGNAAGQGNFPVAAAFTGAAGQYLDIVAPHTFHPGGGSFSVCAWVYLNALGSQEFLSVYTTTGNQAEWNIGVVTGTNLWRIIISMNGATTLITAVPASFVATLNTWTFIAAGFDRTGLYNGRQTAQWISINGVTANVTRRDAVTSIFTGTAPLEMSGVNVGAADRLNGRIGPSGYLPRTMSPAEARFLYNSGAGRQYPF